MRGRIRTVKPEAFTDEDLWDLEIESGLPIFRAFLGLWTQADREGRFEWRPRPLKAAILPYWDGDFAAVLDALAGAGFLLRYESEGSLYGLVRTFSKHQVINAREAKSVLPEPPNSTCTGTHVHAYACTDRVAARPVHAHGEGKGREGNGREVEDGGGGGEPEALPPDQPTPQRPRQATQAPQEGGDDPPPVPDSVSDLAAVLDGLGGSTVSPKDRARLVRVAPYLDRLAKSRGVTRAAVLEAARAACRADCEAKGRRPVAHAVLLAQLETWTAAAPLPRASDAGRYLPPPPEDITHE